MISLAVLSLNTHNFKMNFIFRPYPTHPWIAEWTFEPSGCNTAYRENCSDHFFRSQHTVGQIVPHVENPDWSLLVPVPQNSRINLLSNGFCAYFEHRKVKCGAEVLSPEPGVLWGRFTGIPDPVLVANQPIEQTGDAFWIESDALNAFLVIRDNTFCLISKARVLEDAVQSAEDYFQLDIEEAIQAELDRRSGAVALFENMDHHDSLAVICVESMMKALRPAEGKIPHIWSQSSTTESPRFEINELFPLTLAWSLIEPEIAEELILCSLKIQTNSGALPVHFSPHTTYSVMESPKPLMAKTTEQVWESRKNPEFLNNVLPLLRRHIQWMLHHFDPKRRKVYSWKNQSEPIVPSTYQSDLATVDLAVLLITEIEALNRLRQQSTQQASQSPFFEEERIQIEQNILDQFWNDKDNAFSNAYLRDTLVSLRGFPELTPLLWSNLPQTQRASILEHIREAENLPGQHSVLSWRQSSLDDNSFPLLQQFIFFHALRIADPQGNVLNDFSRLTIQGFVEWHTLSLESNNTLHINPATAAYIMNVQAMHKYRYHAQGEVGGRFSRLMRKVRADRTDLIVITGTLVVLFCVHTFYEVSKAPPPLETLEIQMKSAYADEDAKKALSACMAIMDNYPEASAHARLLAANILMLNGEFKHAEELLSVFRKAYPDNPSAMISLGLAQQLQGNFAAAQTNYYEFCYLFDEIFPDVVKEVNGFRYLMQEGFRTPPKWQEIYRYQFMHEL